MQQNINSQLCNDRDETINLIISEYSKLVPKSIRLDQTGWGKVIHWELRKKFKFNPMNK